MGKRQKSLALTVKAIIYSVHYKAIYNAVSIQRDPFFIPEKFPYRFLAWNRKNDQNTTNSWCNIISITLTDAYCDRYLQLGD